MNNEVVVITSRDLSNIVTLIERCRQSIHGIIGGNSETTLQWSGYQMALRDIETAAVIAYYARDDAPAEDDSARTRDVGTRPARARRYVTPDRIIEQPDYLRPGQARCTLCGRVGALDVVFEHIVNDHGITPTDRASQQRHAEGG